MLAAAAAALGIAALAAQCMPASAVGDTAIRPFQVHVPEVALVDLRRRIAETRWPDREIVTDRSQDNQLGKLQEIARYWGTDYDWRKVEARLNALPVFMTETGVTSAVPGSARNLYLVVSDSEAARAELVERGVVVSEMFHRDGPGSRLSAAGIGAAQLRVLCHV